MIYLPDGNQHLLNNALQYRFNLITFSFFKLSSDLKSISLSFNLNNFLNGFPTA